MAKMDLQVSEKKEKEKEMDSLMTRQCKLPKAPSKPTDTWLSKKKKVNYN